MTNFPEERRGLANALVDAGAKMGPAIGTLAGGLLVANYGWRVLFVALGSLVWLIPWCLYARNTAVAPATEIRTAPGFREILGKSDAWGTSLGLFCYGYVTYRSPRWPGLVHSLIGLSPRPPHSAVGLQTDGSGAAQVRTGSFLPAFGIAAAMLFCGSTAYIFLVGRIETVSWQKANK